MEYIDARRLTGPSLLWNKPGTILDVRCSVEEAGKLIPFWEGKIRKMLAAVGWDKQATTSWPLSEGVSLAFSAPIDALYAASEINEWAWACIDSEFNGAEAPDFEEASPLSGGDSRRGIRRSAAGRHQGRFFRGLGIHPRRG